MNEAFFLAEGVGNLIADRVSDSIESTNIGWFWNEPAEITKEQKLFVESPGHFRRTYCATSSSDVPENLLMILHSFS